MTFFIMGKIQWQIFWYSHIFKNVHKTKCRKIKWPTRECDIFQIIPYFVLSRILYSRKLFERSHTFNEQRSSLFHSFWKNILFNSLLFHFASRCWFRTIYMQTPTREKKHDIHWNLPQCKRQGSADRGVYSRCVCAV
jgi:hypothetical protein